MSLVDMINGGMEATIPAAHKLGIKAVEKEAAENGKADFMLDAVVRDEAGQTVAVTRGLYQLRAHGK